MVQRERIIIPSKAFNCGRNVCITPGILVVPHSEGSTMAKTTPATDVAPKKKRFRPNLGDYRKATEEAAEMRARALKAESEHRVMSEQVAGEVAVTGPLRKQIEKLNVDNAKLKQEWQQQRDWRQESEEKVRTTEAALQKSLETNTALSKNVDDLTATVARLELEVKRQNNRMLWDFLCGR